MTAKEWCDKHRANSRYFANRYLCVSDMEAYAADVTKELVEELKSMTDIFRIYLQDHPFPQDVHLRWRSAEKILAKHSGNEYQSCPNCGTRWLAHEVLPCPACNGGLFVPCVKRATGRTIPDLTKREHICEWQSDVLAQKGGKP